MADRRHARRPAPGPPGAARRPLGGPALISLCLVLERGVEIEHATQLLGRILERMPAVRWLEPPKPNGSLTVADVLRATAEEHEEAVRQWAHDVWQAWAVPVPTVERWLDEALG